MPAHSRAIAVCSGVRVALFGVPDQADFVEVGGVARVLQRRRRRRQELGRADQGQRRGILQVREGRGGVGGRRRLPAPGQRRLGIGRERGDDPSVVLAPRQDLLRDRRADSRARAGRRPRDRCRVAGASAASYVAVADGLRATSTSWAACAAAASGDPPASGEADSIRLEIPLDRVDGVEHRDVRHREEAGGERVLRRRGRCPAESGSTRRRRPRTSDGRVRLGCRVSPTPTPAWPQSVVVLCMEISSPGKASFGGKVLTGGNRPVC